MVRTLASYLADLSDGELERMRADVRRARERMEEEVRGLTFEENLIAQALGRKSRRTGSGGSTKRMSKEQVLDFVNRTFEGRFNSADVVKAFAAEGIETKGESVRQHLRRLADDGRIGRDGNGFVPLHRQGTTTILGSSGPAQASPNGGYAPGEGQEQSLGVASQLGAG